MSALQAIGATQQNVPILITPQLKMLACIVDSVFEQLQSLLLVNVSYELMQVHFHRSADVSNAKALLRALNIYILHMLLIPYSLIQRKASA